MCLSSPGWCDPSGPTGEVNKWLCSPSRAEFLSGPAWCLKLIPGYSGAQQAPEYLESCSWFPELDLHGEPGIAVAYP